MPPSPSSEEALFRAASELPPGATRRVFLDQACAGDAALRQRLDALLAAHEAPDELLAPAEPQAKATMKLDLPDAPDEAVGQTLGRYKLLERVGEGGCGVVYVAEQTEPVRRRVALKVIKLGMDTKQVVARFEAERQALAMMDHPNIAKVLDAGTTETGRPYFVMELVRGIRITDYCDQNNLPTQERLDLFIKVCQAIQHAHQKGIIHRDIKPSNILVTLHDGVPVPKVIDFGIAKATEGRLTDNTVYTQLHQFIGTPAYISPEQAEMSGLDIDTRSDIYSLGVLLYELLAGSTPFDANELMSQGIDAMRRTIREKEPMRPSTRLAALKGEELTTTAKRRSAEAPKLIHLLRGDLDWIVMKCLEKDRTRRYETANGLVADLKRHLNHEPVVARPPSTAYKFQKAWKRNKLAFTAGTAVAGALLSGLTFSVWQATVATRARQAAQTNLQKAVAAEGEVQKALSLAETERDRALQAAKELRRRNYVADLGLANLAIEKGDLGRAQALLGNHRPADGQEDLRGFEWRHLWFRSQGNYQTDLGPYHGFLSGAAISPDGQFVALHRTDPSRVEVIHLASGTVAKSIAMPGEVVPLTYSTSGNLLIGSHDGKVVGWDTRTWKALPALALSFPVAFGHDIEPEIFVACEEDHLSLWNATDWRKIGDLTNAPSATPPLLLPSFGSRGHMMSALAVSSDDGAVYLAGRSGIRRWDLKREVELAPFALPETMCLATSGKGQLASADTSGKVHLLELQTGQILHSFDSHHGWMTGLRFSRNGTRLVSASADRNVVVYDPMKRSITGRLLGHKTEVWSLDISADGRTVVAGAGYGGRVLSWSLADSEGQRSTLADLDLFQILSDGRILLHRPSAPDLEYYDPARESLEPARATRFVQAFIQTGKKPVAIAANAKWVLTPDGNALALWSVFAGTGERTLSHPSGGISGASFSPDSKYLVTAAESDSDVRLWRTDDWTSKLLCHEVEGVIAIGYSGDSRRVAITGQQALVRVFDLEPEPRELVLENDGPSRAFYSVALSGSGRWLAVGTQDNAVHVWDLDAKKRITALHGHIQGVWDLSFSPDDRTLASSSGDSVVLWNVATWQELMSTVEPCHGLQFSPDGRYLASLSQGSRHDLRLRWAPPLAGLDAERVSQGRKNSTP